MFSGPWLQVRILPGCRTSASRYRPGAPSPTTPLPPGIVMEKDYKDVLTLIFFLLFFPPNEKSTDLENEDPSIPVQCHRDKTPAVLFILCYERGLCIHVSNSSTLIKSQFRTDKGKKTHSPISLRNTGLAFAIMSRQLQPGVSFFWSSAARSLQRASEVSGEASLCSPPHQFCLPSSQDQCVYT